MRLWARSIQPKFQPVRPGKEDHLKRWTRFSETFPVDRTDPLSFGPKFPESLVEWIAPCNYSIVDYRVAFEVVSNGGSFDTAEDVKNGVKGYFHRGSFGSAVDGLYSDVSHGSGCKPAHLFRRRLKVTL